VTLPEFVDAAGHFFMYRELILRDRFRYALAFLLVAGATTLNPSSGAAQQPSSIPGTIQAEDFDDGVNGATYRDTTSGNSGGQYRATDVDIELTSDSNGLYNVGWVFAGEWINYTVNVATAGAYDL
jgi:hypothetical protein